MSNSNTVKNWAWDFHDLDTRTQKYTGKDIKIAIIDSGYAPGIPALEKIKRSDSIDFTGMDSLKLIRQLETLSSTEARLDFLRNAQPWSKVNYDGDNKYHGSNIASIIGGTDADGAQRGITSESKIHILKIYNDPQDNSISEERKVSKLLPIAILWAAANGIHLVNVSMKVGHCSIPLHEAVKAAYLNNTILICAAGNSPSPGNMSVEYPAAFQKTLAIGAHMEDGSIKPGTDSGTLVDFLAPGHNIPSFIDPQGMTLNHTSYATAFATGLIALLLEDMGGKASYHELKKRLLLKERKPTVLEKVAGITRLKIDPIYAGYGLLKLDF